MYSIDLETHLTSPGNLAPKPVCVSYQASSLVHAGISLWVDYDDRPWEHVHIVGHNVAYDMACFAQHNPNTLEGIFNAYFDGRIHDTMIATRLRDIATMGAEWKPGYSLATCCDRVLGIKVEKKDTPRLGYAELDGIPLSQWPREAIDYALTDARVTAELWDRLTADQPSRYVDEPRQTLKAWWLHLCTCWGMATDQQSVDEWRRATEDRHRTIEAGLIDAGLVRPARLLRTGRVEPASRNTKAVQAAVVAALGDAAPKTEGGDVSTGSDAVETAADRSGNPVLRSYVEYSSLKKELSTDIPLVSEPIVQARFITPLVTGRTSSKPNVQNLPRDGKMRKCIVPRAGRVFVQADVSGLELGTLAQVLLKVVGWSVLADTILAGRDPHAVMGAAIEGVDYESFMVRLKAGDKKAKSTRQLAKVPDFGIPGGLGADRLVEYARALYGVIITKQQAKDLKAIHLSTYPEHRDYFRWIDSQCYDTGDGDRRATILQLFSGRIRARCSYTEACNTLFQGLGADVTGWMGARLSRACYIGGPSIVYPGCVTPLLGSRIVNYVHDEFIIETAEHLAPYAAEEMSAIMHDAAKVWLPDIPLHAEPCLMDRWYKDVPAKRNAEGLLEVYRG